MRGSCPGLFLLVVAADVTPDLGVVKSASEVRSLLDTLAQTSRDTETAFTDEQSWCSDMEAGVNSYLDVSQQEIDNLEQDLKEQKAAVLSLTASMGALRAKLADARHQEALTAQMEQARKATLDKELSSLRERIDSTARLRGQAELRQANRQFQAQRFAVTKTMEAGDADLNAVRANRQAASTILAGLLEAQWPVATLRKDLIAAITRDLGLHRRTRDADAALLNATAALCGGFENAAAHEREDIIQESAALSGILQDLDATHVESPVSFLQADSKLTSLMSTVRQDVQNRTLDSIWCVSERAKSQAMVVVKEQAMSLLVTEVAALTDAVAQRHDLAAMAEAQNATLQALQDRLAKLDSAEDKWRHLVDKQHTEELAGVSKTAKFLDFAGNDKEARAVDGVAQIVKRHMPQPRVASQAAAAIQRCLEARRDTLEAAELSQSELQNRLAERHADQEALSLELKQVKEYHAKLDAECGLEASHVSDDLQRGLVVQEENQKEEEQMVAPVEITTARPVVAKGDEELSPLEQAAAALGVGK